MNTADKLSGGSRRHTSCGIALTAVLLVAACSGDDDTTTPSIQPPITSDTLFVTTTAEPAPTTVRPTSAAPDTSANTTEPPTTAAPDTTAPPETTTPDNDITEADRQAIVDAAEASWKAFIAAIRDPGNDETLRALAATKTGAALQSSVEYVQELIALGHRAVPHPSIEATFVPDLGSVTIDGSTASIDYCWVGSDLIVEVEGNPDGTDAIVNDDVGILIESEMYELIDGSWLKTGGTTQQIIMDIGSCDDSS